MVRLTSLKGGLFMNFKYSLAVVVLIAVLGVFVFAQTPLNNPPPIIVNANSCSETDSGLNYFAQGTITGSFWWAGTNGTNLTYTGSLTDTCTSSTVLLEGVCGSSINASLSNLAGALYVNCAAPNSNFGCVNGACVFVGTNGTNGTTSLANLIITNITRISTIFNSSNGTNGTTSYNVNVTTYVRNIGSGNAGASVTANTFGFGSPIMMATPAIPAGQTVLVSRYLLGVSPGTYFTSSGADNTTVITETNEFDNVGFANLVIP